MPTSHSFHDSDAVTEQFCAFIDEAVKSSRQADLAGIGIGIGADASEAERAAASVSKHLMQWIERQPTTDATVPHAVETRYLQAVLVDEILLTTRWTGRDAWLGHLLEASLFDSHVAGDRIFERIELLLADPSATRRKLARLYLFALAMGFQGRYRGAASDAPLLAYRHALFQLVYGRSPDLHAPGRLLDDRPYAFTLSPPMPRRRRWRPRWWGVVSVGALLLMLIASEGVWLATTWSVRQALHAHVQDTGLAQTERGIG